MAWHRWLLRGAAVVTSALAFYFSTGFHTLWPLAWLAPLPVLWMALREDKAPPAAGVAFLAYLLGSLNLLAYLLGMAPAGVVAVFLTIPALVFALAVLAARYVARRAHHWAAVFAFPAAWTSYEFLLSSVSPHGTFGSLAYSQIDVLPLIQIASITGALGSTTRPISCPASRRSTVRARVSGFSGWEIGRGARPSARTWISRAWDGCTVAPGSA